MKKTQIFNKPGFSLVELAIVLVIAGLIMGVGLKSCISGITTARIDKTQDQLDTLASFLKRKTCQYGNFSFTVPENLTKDAWGRKIEIYAFGNLQTFPVCGITSTNVTVNLYNETTASNVAFLLISLGQNGKLDSQTNSNPILVKRDDLAEVITLNQLKANCCNSKHFKILTPFLPPIVEGESYNVTLAVKNGIPPYTFYLTSNNPTFNSIIKTQFPQKTNKTFCSLFLSANETLNIVQNATTDEIEIKLKVEDNLGNLKEKTYPVTLIKRKLN